jgi:ankyrin repeat protein
MREYLNPDILTINQVLESQKVNIEKDDFYKNETINKALENLASTIKNAKPNDSKIFRQINENRFSLQIWQALVKAKLIDPISSFFEAIDNNNPLLVKALINHIDPSTNNNQAIINASERGFSEIVDILLADKRVDPTDGGELGYSNAALQEASREGHFEVMESLLNHPLVIQTNGILSIDIECLKYAKEENLPFIERIIKTKGFKISEKNNFAIREACAKGFTKLVEFLLSQSHIDPAVGERFGVSNAPILKASSHGHLGIVKLLMNDKRVDPSANGNAALCAAIKNNHPEVGLALLKNSKVVEQLRVEQFQEYMSEIEPISSKNNTPTKKLSPKKIEVFLKKRLQIIHDQQALSNEESTLVLAKVTPKKSFLKTGDSPGSTKTKRRLSFFN